MITLLWVFGGLVLVLLYSACREIEKLHSTVRNSAAEFASKLETIAEETRKAREELTEQRRERRLKEMELPVRGYQK